MPDIIEGGIYRLRNGDKAGPVERSGRSDYVWQCGIRTWTRAGSHFDNGMTSGLDIVDVWREPKPKPRARDKLICDVTLDDLRAGVREVFETGRLRA